MKVQSYPVATIVFSVTPSVLACISDPCSRPPHLNTTCTQLLPAKAGLRPAHWRAPTGLACRKGHMCTVSCVCPPSAQPFIIASRRDLVGICCPTLRTTICFAQGFLTLLHNTTQHWDYHHWNIFVRRVLTCSGPSARVVVHSLVPRLCSGPVHVTPVLMRSFGGPLLLTIFSASIPEFSRHSIPHCQSLPPCRKTRRARSPPSPRPRTFPPTGKERRKGKLR